MSGPGASDRPNAVAWGVWFGSALIAIAVVKNPFYQGLILSAIGICYYAGRDNSQADAGWSGFLKMGLTFVGISLIYNILISHHGDTIIARLPAGLPIIGGAITAEAAAYGVIFGLTFVSGILAFTALNARISATEMIRLMPRRMRKAATVVSVALNFIPATSEASREIREAQLIRGIDYGSGVTGEVRKAGAVITPLIITGLEKAVVTAESMESRGYGNPGKGLPARRIGKWKWSDFVVVAAGLAPLIGLLVAYISGDMTLVYQPYPKLMMPGFYPLVGLSLTLYALAGII